MIAPASAPAPLEVWILPADRAHDALAAHLAPRTLRRDGAGKPWVPGGPYLNLSHSGALALIAICADTEVGVDLERIRPLRNPPGLSRRMCSPREAAWLADQADPAVALLRLWVRKEAVAKAQGGGLRTALSGLDVLAGHVELPEGRYALCDLPDPAPGYLAALAWRETFPAQDHRPSRHPPPSGERPLSDDRP